MTDGPQRRWEDDERGRGIGDARTHLAALEELTSLAGTADWVTEDPEAHLLPGLRRGAEAAGLTITSFASDPAGRLTVHLKGGAEMSRRDLRQAAWTILGCVAELSSHVRELKDESGVTFDVVTHAGGLGAVRDARSLAAPRGRRYSLKNSSSAA